MVCVCVCMCVCVCVCAGVFQSEFTQYTLLVLDMSGQMWQAGGKIHARIMSPLMEA